MVLVTSTQVCIKEVEEAYSNNHGALDAVKKAKFATFAEIFDTRDEILKLWQEHEPKDLHAAKLQSKYSLAQAAALGEMPGVVHANLGAGSAIVMCAG